MYALYEPEVQTVKSILMALPGLHRDHVKKFPKFSSTYLLDVVELNVKARCLFCWSDPTFEGSDYHIMFPKNI